ncbi:MAG TPA: Ig-like domain-containing protein, partial [Pyrinomonadaceae bacterium]|nr:Ig-like domain-containing protein [Pyrinomonadaceae bacterium]
MTLPKRLVSLLLIYCFVITIAPHPRAAVLATNPVSSTLNDSHKSAITRAYDFLSSLFSSTAKTADNDEDAHKEEGLRFRLSEAPEQPEARPVSKVANATPLSDAETEAILKRLPPIKTEASDETEFALREKSLPPPRTGVTILQPFPAPNEMAAPEQTTAGPLEVVRYSPEGDVPIAPNLSVTFSQPMVAVSSQEEAAENVPVKVSPQPPGKWHWIGTKTLLFEPDVRFPMATNYSITVPAGTKSVNGGSLGGAKTWTFTTPPTTVKNFYPTRASVQRRDTLMFAEFDQRIDPAAVLRNIRVEAGRIHVSVRLATREEIEKDDEVRQQVKRAEKDRWLAFRSIDSSGNPQNALPADANINVSVLAGTPSAEGPRLTTEAQSFPFLTFGPLRVTKHECGYNRSCTPDDNWSVEFSNPLDASVFQDSQIKVEPQVEGLKTSIYNNQLYISGTKPGRTTYRVTLDSSIKDKFGQTLGASAPVGFAVGATPPAIFSAGGSLIVLDPAGPASVPVYTINYDRVSARLYSVAPEDWPAWIYYQRNEQGYSDDQVKKQTTPPGRLVYSKTTAVTSKPEEMVETGIDLSAALKDGFGQMILIVEPEPRPTKKNRWKRDSVEAWIQRTNIGLDAFVDRTDLIGWATSLKDGAPLGGAAITLLPYGIAATSGADGMARMALPPQSPKLPPNLIVARAGNDVAILPEQTQYWTSFGSWFRKDTSDTLRWYVFDDRGLYRPGEEVHVKGWIRRVGSNKDGDVGSP